MGTKNNPGQFDCYVNAEPDEPMFVLLARDVSAPMLVRTWANLREQSEVSPEKVAEARACADAMEQWRWHRRVDAHVLHINVLLRIVDQSAFNAWLDKHRPRLVGVHMWRDVIERPPIDNVERFELSPLLHIDKLPLSVEPTEADGVLTLDRVAL